MLRRDGVFWSGAGALELAYVSPPAPASAATAVVVARAGIGVTVGDAELRGRARLVWELRRGSIDAVSFRAEGVGADLEVTGVGVRAVQRSGSGVRVELQAPVSGRVELDLRWSAPIGAAAESRAALPQIVFEDVFRGESALQLARDGEVEVVPEASGWTPVSAAALPGWAQGLVEGTPSAAFTASSAASGSLTLLRFVPLEGPPVVVDVAAYTIATSREGRALIRAHYEVRNERAASLRIRPPPGFEILGVRVAGETAVIARDREGAWRVPLQRSVDTVSGLLSFPVEVALLGEAKPWARRERRELPLPRLDAPVAVTRVTLHLPPGYRSRLQPGDGEVVDAFTKGEGITYGLGVGEVGAGQADALFQGAVKRWLANDFKGAQAELDQLKSMGASNENIARLQGNLDLISGRGGQQDATAQRRIREQAKARAVDEQVALEQLQKQAEESRKSGDYGAAEQQYKAALEVGDRLAQLEQKESVEQQSRNDALRSELKSTAEEAERSVVSKKAGRYRSARRVEKGQAAGRSRSDHASSSDRVRRRERPPIARTRPRSFERGPGRAMYEFMFDGAADDDGDAGKRETRPRPTSGRAQRQIGDEGKELAAVEIDGSAVSPDGEPMDQVRNAPVGGTTRDFTAVIDASPTVTSDSAGLRLSGSSGAESRPVVERQSLRGRAFAGLRRANRRSAQTVAPAIRAALAPRAEPRRARAGPAHGRRRGRARGAGTGEAARRRSRACPRRR